MPVTIGAVTYGCSYALEKRAYGIADAGRALSVLLGEGGVLPSIYVIDGVIFNVVSAGITPNGTTSNQTALNTAFNANRGGTPTLLVLAPSFSNYISSDVLNVSANTYVCGYGATIEKTTVTKYANIYNGNSSGMFGVRLYGPAGASSKWIERFEDFPTNPDANSPSKNGNVSNNNGGGVTNDAWHVTSGRTDIIIFDCQGFGSLTGFIRAWGTSTNHLYENNTMHRSTSDSIHMTNSANQITCRRNNIYFSGDDAISVVSYSKTENPTAPQKILVEYNNVCHGRGRGLTVVGGLDILHQFNNVDYTLLAPYLYAATSTHNTHNVRAICRNNSSWRGGQRESNHSNSGIFGSCFTYTGATVDVTSSNNRCYTYNDWYSSGGDFFRGAPATGVTVTETNNLITTLVAAD
jgi:hypothetical protein